MSAPQTTPRTANKFGNILVLPRCDDRDDRPDQFLWLKVLHASYFFPLNQVHKDRVLYSVDKNFETKGDSRNFCDEQILKCGRHVCQHCVISRATFAQCFDSSRHRAFYEISARVVKKL